MVRKLLTKKCVYCGTPFNAKSVRHKYCSEECAHGDFARTYRTSNKTPMLPTATTGTINELRVSLDLLNKGYEVFRPLTPNCSCDLAILKNSKLTRIEVTTGRYSQTGKVTYPPHKQEYYDIFAIVLPDKILSTPSEP